MTLFDFATKAIFELQDFREWWYKMNGADTAKYPINNTPEGWEQIFSLYKKYKASAAAGDAV